MYQKIMVPVDDSKTALRALEEACHVAQAVGASVYAVHVVDLAPFEAGGEPASEALALAEELRKYDEALYEKPRWFVLNKLDVLPEEERAERVADFLKAVDWNHPQPDDEFEFDIETPRVFEISAINRQGTADLVYAIHRYIQRKKELAAKLLAVDEVDAVAVVSTTDRNVLKPE